MTRPIIWALGVLVTTAVSGVGAGDHLTRAVRGSATDAPAATAPTASSSSLARERALTLSADLRGHYVAHPSVNGQTVRMLVDTGASLVAISGEDAAKLGLRVGPRDFTMPLQSANGTVRGAPVRIDEIRIGDISVRGVEAVVLPPGLLGTNLLGMSFLRRLRGFEIASGRLTLRS